MTRGNSNHRNCLRDPSYRKSPVGLDIVITLMSIAFRCRVGRASLLFKWALSHIAIGVYGTMPVTETQRNAQ